MEHILPDNPGENWSEFDSEIADTYRTRLGNMALLQASKNSDAGNAAFAEKKALYKQSSFITTREVATHKLWGPQQVDDRQRKMAELALKVWPLS